MTRAAYASTEICTSCHERPGFPSVSSTGAVVYECVSCRMFQAQCNAASAQLSDAIAPTLGMWAAQWMRAGLPVNELVGIIEILTGDWARHDVAEEYRRRTLRTLAATYRHASQEEEVPPLRAQVQIASLRRIARVMFDHTAPASLRDRPYFFSAADEQIHAFAGADLVVCSLPEGERAVIYADRSQDSFLCPAELWPNVAAALGHLSDEEQM